MFEKMKGDTSTRRCNMCSHRHHYPMNLSAHGEAQMMEVRFHRIPSISNLSSSISFQFSLKRCMKHAATTRLALFFDQQARFFFLVESFPRYLCALSSWFKCDRSVFNSSARLSHLDAAGRNSSLEGGTGVSIPVGARLQTAAAMRQISGIVLEMTLEKRSVN